MTYVLGINAQQADVSAVLLLDGEPLVAIEEERLSRIKHCMGFPTLAVQRCLELAGIEGVEVGHVAVGANPRANATRRALVTLRRRPTPAYVLDRVRHAARTPGLYAGLSAALSLPPDRLPPVHLVEHHPAHLASTFYVSPFESAALCSADGFGDFVSATMGEGRGNTIRVVRRVPFPHSLGLLYTALTQYLGFTDHGDEYKVMGLSAYGKPAYVDKLRRLVSLRRDGTFRLDRSYFLSWTNWYAVQSGPPGDRRPRLRRLHSPKLERLLGPARDPEEAVLDRHADIAASLQRVFEEASIHMLRVASRLTTSRALCLAGGCFMNSVLNGKIRQETDFEEVFVQPAAGDGGLALGAAYAVWCNVLGEPRSYVMRDAYLGPSYSEAQVEAALGALGSRSGYEVTRFEDEGDLCRVVAELIAEGAVVGWFQGRMEWGSRALGNRSILADPRRREMRERLNEKVKRRESFRPFAPAILEEALDDFFVGAVRDPFMVNVYPLRPDKQDLVPAVCHVDGTARPQTVARTANRLFYDLIEEFASRTGIPMLLNTSLNENEPIVDTPRQALESFLRTDMDALVLHTVIVRRLRPHDAKGEAIGGLPSRGS